MVGVVADIQWENVHLAGAFLIGSIFGTIVTLRVVKAAITLLGQVAKKGDDQPSS